MGRIDQEVAIVYGSGYDSHLMSVDETDTRYNRTNIRQWLLHWHEFSQLGSYVLSWTQAVADVEQAVSNLPDRYQDLFDLYCVLGYSEEECIAVFGWSGYRVFEKRWSELVTRIYRRLSDRRMHAGTPFARGVTTNTGGYTSETEVPPRPCTCRN